MNVAEAKQIFYNTLKRNGVTVDEYAASPQGMNLLKSAAAVSTKAGLQKKASMLSLLMQVGRHIATPDDTVGRLIGAGAIGTVGGYSAGNIAGKLTSPTDASIGNLQKRELISEYDSAIEELQRRLEANSMR